MVKVIENISQFDLETVDLGDQLSPKTHSEQSLGVVTVPGLRILGSIKIGRFGAPKNELDQKFRDKLSSAWRWLADKILPHSMERAYGHAVYHESKVVSNSEIEAAFNKVFIEPKIYLKDEKTKRPVVDFAFSSSVSEKVLIIEGFGDIENKISDGKDKKVPIILKLNRDESRAIESNGNSLKQIKDIFKKAPFVIVLLEESEQDVSSRSYIISSHFPQDGVVAGSLLQDFTKTLYGESSVKDINKVSSNDVKVQLELSDAIETDGSTISESMYVEGTAFEELSRDFDSLQASLLEDNHRKIQLPKSIYFWLRILSNMKVDGNTKKVSSLRFNSLITEQLNLFEIKKAGQILQKLKDKDFAWLEENNLLYEIKDHPDYSYRFQIPRDFDIARDIVGRLLGSLPPTLYAPVWNLCIRLGVVKALFPDVVISTIPENITVEGNVLEVGGICTTALSEYEQIGMVMMLFKDKLILRWKYNQTN